ncbi:ADP-ribosylation factor GTPase-activating protein 2 [Cimex lectularius]|uniref:Arf-GAP domain-containing protein n=1 Tax=Cimex lectularius TaxID=79782 RepID=A0A8I6RHB1_CIMLE|nr:ADP-ribosylation factor GTPase-activating protein 2 [Cimex lectularius]
MAGGGPTEKDIENLFKRLRSIPANKFCFDCAAKNPTWASVTYGVFICIDCSAVHRGLGVHLTFVRSTLFDTNWTWIQLHKMQLGGNSNAKHFFAQHDCTTKDFQTKYNSRTAHLYKEKLENAASHAIATHGNTLNLEPEPQEEEKEKELDFFDEHTGTVDVLEDQCTNATMNKPVKTAGKPAEETITKTPDISLSVSEDDKPRKPTIGGRIHQTKRTGLAAKKMMGGLGAQKVNVNFADIEKEAELAEKLRVQTFEDVKQDDVTEKEKEEQFNFMRLAYEDLSMKQKKEEEKIRAVDPKKAKQMERLGMGFGARSGVSHSALSDMKTIQQENLQKSRKTESFFDDFNFSSNQNSSYMFKTSSDSQNLFSDSKDTSDLFGKSKSNDQFETKMPIQNKLFDKIHNKSYEKSFGDFTSEKPLKITRSSSAGLSEAQKKFGTAKSISSDQYFSDKSDTQWERNSNLSRFEGSTSISSADYFGRNECNNRSSGLASQIQTPDLDDVRESVRQGVTKVAGKLSSLANGVMSSIQEKYGL